MPILAVNRSITIPDRELKFSFARASGPGGQNVNKVSSKATLHFAAANSPSLPPDVKARLLSAFKSRLTKEGVLVLSSQAHRDQPRNISACLSRLKEMILSVAKAPKKRRETKPSRGSKVRRLKAKKQRAELKEGRRGKWGE
jgi:ribosome-associated protein